MTQTAMLPGLELIQDTRSLYGDPGEIFLDPLPRFPDPVRHGLRRALTTLQRAGVAAYADGRRLYTPMAGYEISLSGQLSTPRFAITDFDRWASQATRHMAERSGFSFTRAFREQYLQEDHHA